MPNPLDDLARPTAIDIAISRDPNHFVLTRSCRLSSYSSDGIREQFSCTALKDAFRLLSNLFKIHDGAFVPSLRRRWVIRQRPHAALADICEPVQYRNPRRIQPLLSEDAIHQGEPPAVGQGVVESPENLAELKFRMFKQLGQRLRPVQRRCRPLRKPRALFDHTEANPVSLLTSTEPGFSRA